MRNDQHRFSHNSVHALCLTLHQRQFRTLSGKIQPRSRDNFASYFRCNDLLILETIRNNFGIDRNVERLLSHNLGLK